MIFSTDRCPLCNDKLQFEVMEGNKGVWFKYFCDKKELVYNPTAQRKVNQCHYLNSCFQDGGMVTMVIGSFEIYHSESSKTTTVFDAQKVGNVYEKLIFRTKLLDLDYSKPHLVLDKLKLLVTFS